MIPVHMRDHHIGNVRGRQSELSNRIGSLDEVLNAFSFDDVLVIAAGVNEDVLAAAPHQPDHHLQIDFAGLVGAGNQAGDREVRIDAVA